MVVAHWEACLRADWIAICHMSYGKYYLTNTSSSSTLSTKVSLRSEVVLSDSANEPASTDPVQGLQASLSSCFGIFEVDNLRGCVPIAVKAHSTSSTICTATTLKGFKARWIDVSISCLSTYVLAPAICSSRIGFDDHCLPSNITFHAL